MIRAFIAVKLAPTAALAPVLETITGLGSGVRPVSPAQLHLTLRFLGDIDPDSVADVSAAIELAVAEARVVAFDAHLTGLGAFPSSERPRVVWVGLRGVGPLTRIVEALDPLLDSLGLVPRDKPWQAHLTVARVKARPPGALFELLKRCAETDFGSQPIAAVYLIRSELSRAGPVYSDLHRVELVAGAS